MSSLSVGTIVIIVLCVALGLPLFVLMGGVSAWLLMASGNFPHFEDLKTIVEMTRELSDKEVLLSIPFFVISGAFMSEGDIARRLIRVASTGFAWLPGGLAVSAVAACIFFAAISGSSPVTVIAIGSIMYPALVKAGYKESFSAGLVTSAGSLGILIPPSIPMIVYAIMVPGGFNDPPGYNVGGEGGSLNLVDLFVAGVGPGLLIGAILAGHCIVQGLGQKQAREPFSILEFGRAVRSGAWSLMLPVLILGGTYSGIFTPTQAAAVSVIYALVVEFYIHRSLTWRDLPRIMSESSVLIGSLLVILALAQGFSKYLTLAQVADKAVLWFSTMELTPVAFLIIVNILLLIVGCFMDILSAILIFAPLITPIGVGLGIHPMHLAIIFIVNLEIGYLTPPVGLNLFVASTLFKKSLGEMIRSVVPFVALMLLGLGIITYVPSVALGPVAVKNGGDFYVPFPERRLPMISFEVGEPVRFLSAVGDAHDGASKPEQDDAAAAPTPGRPMTLEEMMAAAAAEREEEAMEGLSYETLQDLLRDFRRIRSGELQLGELADE